MPIEQTAGCGGVTMEKVQINVSDKTVYILSRHKTNKMHKLVHYTLNTIILYDICDIII